MTNPKINVIAEQWNTEIAMKKYASGWHGAAEVNGHRVDIYVNEVKK